MARSAHSAGVRFHVISLSLADHLAEHVQHVEPEPERGEREQQPAAPQRPPPVDEQPRLQRLDDDQRRQRAWQDLETLLAQAIIRTG